MKWLRRVDNENNCTLQLYGRNLFSFYECNVLNIKYLTSSVSNVFDLESYSFFVK